MKEEIHDQYVSKYPFVLHNFNEKKTKSTKNKLVLSIFLPGKLYILPILDYFPSPKDMMKCHLLSEAFPDSSGQMMLPSPFVITPILDITFILHCLFPICIFEDL